MIMFLSAKSLCLPIMGSFTYKGFLPQHKMDNWMNEIKVPPVDTKGQKYICVLLYLFPFVC